MSEHVESALAASREVLDARQRRVAGSKLIDRLLLVAFVFAVVLSYAVVGGAIYLATWLV